MPGTSISATLMSTDVPLLLFWAIGLLAIVHHVERPSLAAGVALGVAVGLGLNAKYAMIYLPLCYAVYAVVSPKARATLRHPGTWAALAVALLLIAPNLIWNAEHQFATFEHTRENANWNGRFPNILGLLAFLGTQIAIAGPVPFAAFMLAAIGRVPEGIDGDQRRLLLAMSLPVFLLIAAQALISKANGNWAATGFPAAGRAGRRRHGYPRVAARHDLHARAFGGSAVRHFLRRLVRRRSSRRARSAASSARWSAGAISRPRCAISPSKNDLKTVVFVSRGLTASMIYELRDSGLDIRAYVDEPQRAGRPFRDDAAVEPGRPWPGSAGLCRRRTVAGCRRFARHADRAVQDGDLHHARLRLDGIGLPHRLTAAARSVLPKQPNESTGCMRGPRSHKFPIAADRAFTRLRADS